MPGYRGPLYSFARTGRHISISVEIKPRWSPWSLSRSWLRRSNCQRQGRGLTRGPGPGAFGHSTRDGHCWIYHFKCDTEVGGEGFDRCSVAEAFSRRCVEVPDDVIDVGIGVIREGGLARKIAPETAVGVLSCHAARGYAGRRSRRAGRSPRSRPHAARTRRRCRWVMVRRAVAGSPPSSSRRWPGRARSASLP